MTHAVATHPLPGRGAPFPTSGALDAIARTIGAVGGRPIAVGGCVRDHLLGIESKDIDIEVFGVALASLETALEDAGYTVHRVGRSFGVLKVTVEHDGERETFDVALPRRENKVGQGHRGFVVESDPEMSFSDAAARRDFTINAIGVDLSSGELLDPHGGAADLERGVLRHVSPAFSEDPLRVLRACQFAARLGLSIADETLDLCRSLEPELSTLPKERLWEEMKKLLLKSPWPSVGLCALVDTGAISLFPELHALMGCPQEPEWHPEGDVWVHNLLVVDEAARVVREEALDGDEALYVLVGALCHDLGKPLTTDTSDGRVRSKNHEAEGEAPTRDFLGRLGAPNAVVEAVVPLVRDHLKPWQLYRDRDVVSDGALRRLALRVPLERLVRVARADFRGRTTPDALLGDDVAGRWLLEQAERLAVKDAAPEPLLLGRDLLARGHRPGKALGELLKLAFEAQLNGAFTDHDGALAWADAHLAVEGQGE